MSVPDIQNVGGQSRRGFPMEQLQSFPHCFYGDKISTSMPAVAAASSYSRSAWSNSFQPHVMAHKSNAVTDRRAPGNSQLDSSTFQRPTIVYQQQPHWTFSRALPEEDDDVFVSDITLHQPPRSNSSSDPYSTNQRSNSSSDPYTTKQQSNSSSDAHSTNQQSSSSYDPHSTNQLSFAAHGRLLDLVQRPTTLRNLSITDANKLQQQGHENVTGGNGGYRGDSYHGDCIPSKCSFNEMSVPDIQRAGGQNPGSFPRNGCRIVRSISTAIRYQSQHQ